MIDILNMSNDSIIETFGKTGKIIVVAKYCFKLKGVNYIEKQVNEQLNLLTKIDENSMTYKLILSYAKKSLNDLNNKNKLESYSLVTNIMLIDKRFARNLKHRATMDIEPVEKNRMDLIPPTINEIDTSAMPTQSTIPEKWSGSKLQKLNENNFEINNISFD